MFYDGSLCLLALLPVAGNLQLEVLAHLALALLDFALFEEENPLQVGCPCHRGVAPALAHMIESPVKDGDGVVDAGSLEAVAGSGVSVGKVHLRRSQGHSRFFLSKEGCPAPPL